MTAERVVIGDAELWHGDCLEVMAAYEPLDAVITDPPYERAMHAGPFKLESTGARRDGRAWHARPDFAEAAFALREPGAAVRVRLGRALPSR